MANISEAAVLSPTNMWIAMGLSAALFLAYQSIQPQGPANTEPTAYLRTTDNGKTSVTRITRDQCTAQPERLWAVSQREVACIAYVAPKRQPTGDTAIVFFHGDFSSEDQNVSEMQASRLGYQRRAQRVADRFKVPVYVMGRPGIMGSTGFHVIGGVHEENQLMASALEGLKSRHRIKRLVLGGQSGGARLAAQLLVSGRNDIACAAMASGAYDLPRLKGGGRSATNIWGEPSKSLQIPLRDVGNVVVDGKRRLFIVGDPRDERTPFPEQRRWAEALAQAGHHAVLLEAAGGGKEHHGLSTVGLYIAGLCAAGRSDQEIQEFAQRQRAAAGRKSN